MKKIWRLILVLPLFLYGCTNSPLFKSLNNDEASNDIGDYVIDTNSFQDNLNDMDKGEDKDKEKGKVRGDLVCTLTLEEDGTKIETIDAYEHSGMIVSKQRSSMSVVGDDVEVIKYMSLFVSNTYAPFKDYEGIDFKMEDISNGFFMTLDIDLKKVSKETLVEMQVIAEDEVFTFIGVDATKEVNESMGATCYFDD